VMFFASLRISFIKYLREISEVVMLIPPMSAYLKLVLRRSKTQQQTLKLAPNNSNLLAPFGRPYAVAGRKGEARKILGQLMKLSRWQYVMPDHIASIYTAMGDKDQAFAWLHHAYERRDDRLIFLKVDATWDSRCADPRFASIVRRIGN
jgi:hypothetical protein